MKQKWGREQNAGNWPSDKPLWAIGASLIALASVIAIGYYRYKREWTPLERFYLPTYVWTRLAGTLRAGDAKPPRLPQNSGPFRNRTLNACL